METTLGQYKKIENQPIAYKPMENYNLIQDGAKIAEGGFGIVDEIINLDDMNFYARKKFYK